MFQVDSDNARQTVPLDEIVAEQRMVMLPGQRDAAVGEQYGRGFEKPLFATVTDTPLSKSRPTRPPNQPPHATFDPPPGLVFNGETVTLDGSTSGDPDGSIIRIGYADQNGQDYVAVGKLLRERAALPPGGATMDGIVTWMRAQPDRGVALMRENPSYIFFRELTGPGPLGAMGVAVTERGSVAADPMFEPLGAPVFLDLASDFADGLWVAQDVGGAIKGANRFDTFWGAGTAAKSIAGGLSSNGTALILLPKGVAARLAAPVATP